MKIARTTFGFILIMVLAFSAIPMGVIQPVSAASPTTNTQIATLSHSIFAEDFPDINISEIRGELLGVGIIPDGSPVVVLAELGLDISGFNFENPEYEGFLGAAILNIHGTLVSHLLMELMGNETMGEMSQKLGQLINLLTNSLIIVYTNVSKSQGETRSSTVANSFSQTLGISIQHAKDIYIEIDNIALFVAIYAIRSTYTQLAQGIIGTFPTPGLASNFNLNDYSEASDSVAVMLIAKFGTQILSVGALGYLKTQVVQGTGNHSLDIAEVAGMSSLVPSTTAKSFVVGFTMTSNITSTDYPSYSRIIDQRFAVFNLTDYGSAVNSYRIYFEGNYPPLITLTRVVSPETINSGGTVSVTVTATNNGTEPITNVLLDESKVLGLGNYTSVSIIGDGNLSKTVSTLNPGESITITYQLHFETEGTYILNSPILRYDYAGDTYYKWTPLQEINVQPNLPGLVQSAIQDYMPYSLIPFGLIGLALIFNIKSWVSK